MKNKVIKLLKMTTSSNDHEALNAIRMANLSLKKEGMHWDDFFFKASPLSNAKETDYIRKINTLKRELDNSLSKKPSLSNTKETEYVKRINKLKNELDNCKRNSSIHKSVEQRKKISNPHIEVIPHRVPRNVKEKIEICLEVSPNNSFLNSIDEFFNKEGFLTQKQLDALDTIYRYL